MVSSDPWSTATSESDGRVLLYRFRQSVPTGADTNDFPHALEVNWPYDADARNGMPPEEVNAQQIAFEDAIEPLTEGELGYLMHVTTGAGVKTWLFYARDLEAWMARLNECLAGHDEYPLDIPNWPDPGWQAWREFVESVAEAE